MAIAPVIEVIIGLIFVYFVFSMLCSGVNEFVSQAFAKRSGFLRAGVRQMLDNSSGDPADPHRDAFNDEFWAHPLVRQLGQSLPAKTSWRRRAWRALWRAAQRLFTAGPGKAAGIGTDLGHPLDEGWRPPSYVPKSTFVTVVLELRRKHPDLVAPDSGFGAAIASMEREAGADVGRLRAAVELWFDNQMERVSGWYKRESKTVLFWLGVVVVLALNVDTVTIARTLWADPTQRQVVADAAVATVQGARQPTTTGVGPAGTAAAPPAPVVCPRPAAAATGPTSALVTTTTMSPNQQVASAFACIRSLSLPIGWRWSGQCLVVGQSNPQACRGPRSRLEDVWLRLWRTPAAGKLLKLAGWFLTAGALAFGAPFWFDLLNRFGSLRSAGAKPAS